MVEHKAFSHGIHGENYAAEAADFLSNLYPEQVVGVTSGPLNTIIVFYRTGNGGQLTPAAAYVLKRIRSIELLNDERFTYNVRLAFNRGTKFNYHFSVKEDVDGHEFVGCTASTLSGAIAGCAEHIDSICRDWGYKIPD